MKNGNHFVFTGAWIIQEFVHPRIERTVIQRRDYGLQSRHVFVDLRLCIGMFVRHSSSVAPDQALFDEAGGQESDDAVWGANRGTMERDHPAHDNDSGP